MNKQCLFYFLLLLPFSFFAQSLNTLCNNENRNLSCFDKGLEIDSLSAKKGENVTLKVENYNNHRYELKVKEVQEEKRKLRRYVNEKEGLSDGFNPRKENPFGMNMNIGGPSLILSFSVDYFITPSINAEVGFGLVGSFAGMKLHVFGGRDGQKWTPYVGLYGAILSNSTTIPSTKRNGFYIPIGVQYMGNDGFIFGLENAIITKKMRDPVAGLPVWGAIKLGYHF